MKILVGCETSGTVRRAFAARGHDAWSCDLLPAEDGSNRHLVGDIRDFLNAGWDMLAVMHPPCTRLCRSGSRWLHVPPPGRTLEEMWTELDEGAAVFSACWNAPIERRCIENPIIHKYAIERIANYQRQDQVIQPWWFGEPAFKGTALWLKNLPPLVATNRLSPPASGTREHKTWSIVHRAQPGPDRWRERSRTYESIAEAMATQWGDLDGLTVDQRELGLRAA
ncbi:MAG: hypothetical protein JWP92_3699 [Caulobacter sp.]|nr:hypothetical protein [Caulobacter sp.]